MSTNAPTNVTLLQGDARAVLATLPAGSVQTVVTSPPYYGLRDYGVAGQLGGEATPPEYVASLVGIMREVRRVLRDDGTLWLNLGDSYASTHTGVLGRGRRSASFKFKAEWLEAHGKGKRKEQRIPEGLKPKDLIGIPWRVAFALQADGWWLRSELIWHKPSGSTESVRDRPTKAHEQVFLLTKQQRYFYDTDAIRSPTGANKRSVWSIPTSAYKGAHFATFPEKLVEPCVLAGSRPGDTVLDPFCGSGTVGAVARRLERSAVLIDLNPDYLRLAAERLGQPPKVPARRMAASPRTGTQQLTLDLR